MPFITTEDRGAVRVITYANAPFGTMTAAGAAEMFDAVLAAGEALSVRVIVITGGLPGIFIRHYEVQELSDAADAIERGCRVRRRHPVVSDRRASTHSRT